MFYFRDEKGNQVRLSFKSDAFDNPPEHVLVICRYHDAWLLTNHKQRGLEFPGGKIERDETAEEAALREVMEETGAEINQLVFIGQYQVTGGDGIFVKNVYFAEIKQLSQREHYFETSGPVLLDETIDFESLDHRYSFIMKDGVLQKCMEEIKRRRLF